METPTRVASWGLIALLVWGAAARAQSPADADPPPAEAPAGDAPAPPPPGGPAPAEGAESGGAPPEPAGDAPAPGTPVAEAEKIQLSFNQVDIEFIVKWLAETTGKSIVKENSVNPKLTIVSPNKLAVDEALELVYQSLALHGVAVVENGNVILLVPEEVGRKMGPQTIDTSEEPGGTQLIAKVIELRYARAEKLKDKLKSVLSEKAKVDVDERANKIIVTDTANNVRLLQELIDQLDVPASSDTTTEVFTLEYAKADELVTILEAMFGGRTAKPAKPQPGKKPPKAAAGAGADIRFTADKTSNRIIVTAPPERIPEIRELIETLDKDKPPDVTVRVLPLRNVDASALAGEIGPMYQKLRGESLKDAIEVGANTRSNSLIVLSSKKNFEAIRELVEKLDIEEAQEKVIRSFTLQNADAEDIAEQLSELYQPNRSSYRYYYYYYYSRDRGQQGEAKFVSDRRRNAIIAIAPPNSMENIAQMIKALDAPVDGDSLAPRIYQLKYVSAFDIEELLNELFTKKTHQRGYYDWDYGYDEVDRDIGKLYGKVRVTSEYYSNSIIVTSNSEENFEAIEKILEQLDVPSETGDTTVTIALKFAKAVTIANSLNIIFAQDGAPPRRQGPRPEQQNRRGGNQQQQLTASSTSFELEEEVYEESYFPWLGSAQQDARSRAGRASRPVSDLVGKVRVVPDIRTNSVLVSSNTHLMPDILRVIQDLDVPTAQVLIEAKIIEVGADLRDRIGVRWSPDGDQIFDTEDLDDSLRGSVSGQYSEGFVADLLGDALGSGLISGDINLDILVQFLRKNTDSRVRAEPRINVEDNERGKLFVGSRVPFISGSLSTVEGGRNDTFEYIDVGIILEVTPHINANGDVALAVRVESSQIRPEETLFGGAILDTRNYRTDITVSSGQTLVLGGIIQQEQSEVERKVPFLGDIPVLGWLFKKKDTIRRDVELMVFLRPTVTRTPEEVRRLMEEEKKRTVQIEAWEEQIEEERKAREAEREKQ